MRRSIKFLAAAAAAALPTIAGAQAVRFAGSTLGCYYQGVLGAGCAVGASSLFGTLSFTAGSFDVFTDPAATSGTSEAAIGNSGPGNSLGTVASTGGAFSAPTTAGNLLYLRLQISFGTPIHTQDVNGTPNDNIFTVDYRVSGNSSKPGSGGINFIPVGGLIGSGSVFDAYNGLNRNGNFYTGTFANGDVAPLGPGGGTASGVVNFHALDTRSITSGNSATLTSFFQINSTVVTPEPATVTLMATGLLAVFGAGFARRRNNG